MTEIECTSCHKWFASREALEMHNQVKHTASSTVGLSKTERKELRQEEKEQLQRKLKQKKRLKKCFIYSILILSASLFAYWLFYLVGQGESYSKGQVHWHAELSITLCGKNVPLPRPGSGSVVHGKLYVGTPFMHLHDEPLIHIEGTVRKKEDITLGKFMDVIGLNFKDNELLKFKNGDACPDGHPGITALFVNSRPSSELSQKVIVDGERYNLRFE